MNYRKNIHSYLIIFIHFYLEINTAIKIKHKWNNHNFYPIICLWKQHEIYSDITLLTNISLSFKGSRFLPRDYF